MADALLVIDMQNDFFPGGALPVAGGESIISRVNQYCSLFSRNSLPVFASRDWHPPETSHFAAFGGKWPPHCIKNTWGAAFHVALELPAGTRIISKGSNPGEHGYSVFQGSDETGTKIEELLRQAGISGLFLCGIATEFCVQITALDSRERGLETRLCIDAIRGVDLHPGNSGNAISKMIEYGIVPVDFSQTVEKIGRGK